MQKTLAKASLGLVLLTSLSGCLITQNREFNQQSQGAADLIDELSGLPVVAQNDMPTSGGATYSGIASLNVDSRLDLGSENNDYHSDVSLTADFGTNDLTGQMTNFQSPDGEVGGTLTLENGQIIDNFVDGDFVGTIDDDGDMIALELDIDGFFQGDGTGEPAGVSGNIDGDYTGDTGNGNIFGSYAATID